MTEQIKKNMKAQICHLNSDIYCQHVNTVCNSSQFGTEFPETVCNFFKDFISFICMDLKPIYWDTRNGHDKKFWSSILYKLKLHIIKLEDWTFPRLPPYLKKKSDILVLASQSGIRFSQFKRWKQQELRHCKGQWCMTWNWNL